MRVKMDSARSNREYEFLCFCRACRKEWSYVPETKDWNLHAEPRYYAQFTCEDHLNKQEERHKKSRPATYDVDVEMAKRWKEMRDSPLWRSQVVGGHAFGRPGRQMSTRQVLDRELEGEYDESDEEFQQTRFDTREDDSQEEFTSEGEEEHMFLSDAEDADDASDEDVNTPPGTLGREELLDSMRSLEDLGILDPKLGHLAEQDPTMARKVIENAKILLDGKTPLRTIRESTINLTSSGDLPGFTLCNLLRKWKAPFVSRFSCTQGHGFSEVRGSPCEHPGCNKAQNVRSFQQPLDVVFRHLLRQPEVAANIQWGPKWQAKFLAELKDATRAEPVDCTAGLDNYSETDDRTSRVSQARANSSGAYEGVKLCRTGLKGYTLTSQGLDLPADEWSSRMRNIWESPAMADLKQKVKWDENDRQNIPIVFQLFVDGFQPFQSAYNMVVVMLKVLNLPTSIANDYIVPIVIIDGKEKPEFIDANLQECVNYLRGFAPMCGDPASDCLVALDGFTQEMVGLRPLLLQVACDMKGMMMVSHHREPVAKECCNKCTSKARQVTNPTNNFKQNVYDTVGKDGEPLWQSKDDQNARADMEWANNVATTRPELRGKLPRYVGRSVFADLWYFDVVWGFPVCSMHQVMNVVKRAFDQLLEDKGWDSETIGRFVQTDEGKTWLAMSGLPENDFVGLIPPQGIKSRQNGSQNKKAPTMMQGWPNSRATVKPRQRHSKQAFRCASGVKPPSYYNGHPSHAMHFKAQGKEETSFRKIKASECKDHAVSGALPTMAYFGGTHDLVTDAYAHLCYVIKQLCSHVVDVAEIRDLMDAEMSEMIHKLVKVLPPPEQIPALHALSHLPEQILRYGPLPDYHSFPFEGKFAKLKPLAQINKAMPAATLAARVATEMGLRDVSRLYCSYTPPKNEQIVLSTATRTKDRLHSPQSLSHLLYRAHTDQRLRQLIQHRLFDVTEYKTVTIKNSVEIQGRHSSRTKRDNRWVLLRSSSDQPGLGHVESILRVRIRAEEESDNTIDDRIYLLVDLHRLGAGEPWMRDQYEFWDKAPPQKCLVTIDQVLDQCFLGPHCDYPRREGEYDDMVPKEPASYDRHLVYTKGRLRNDPVPRDAPFSCSPSR